MNYRQIIEFRYFEPTDWSRCKANDLFTSDNETKTTTTIYYTCLICVSSTGYCVTIYLESMQLSYYMDNQDIITRVFLSFLFSLNDA